MRGGGGLAQGACTVVPTDIGLVVFLIFKRLLQTRCVFKFHCCNGWELGPLRSSRSPTLDLSV